MSTIPKFPVCFVANDQLPNMVATLVNVDLTGYTITLHMRRADGTVLIKAATAIDLLQGHFAFEWSAGDLQAGINQETEIQFVEPGGKPLTSSLFLVDVRDEVA